MTENARSKRSFYHALARELQSRGWTRLPKTHGLPALFGKRLGDLILTVGVSESHLYPGRVTAAFRLAGHTLLTLSDPEAPRIRIRVGRFLTPGEYRNLVDPEFTGEMVSDAWWRRNSTTGAQSLAQAIDLAEPRFLAQPGLVEELRGSKRHSSHVAMLRKIANSGPHADLADLPAPPQEWVRIAFSLLPNALPKYRLELAEKVAADVWNTFRALPEHRNNQV